MGRGRRGNTWESPLGSALFSFALEEDQNLTMEDYSKLPLIIGISLLEGIKKIENLDYKFKWTNDIYLEDKKLSGILVEKVEGYFVIGIGINVNNLEFVGGAKNGVSLKKITNKNYDIELVIGSVINSFQRYWSQYLQGKWKEILFEINNKNYLLGKEIEIKLSNGTIKGVGGQILNSGKLEVKIENKGKEEVIELVAGEVHIKF